MKKFKKFILIIISFLIISPNFSLDVIAITEIGTYNISGEPSWYYIWNVTEAINATTDFFPRNNLTTGDKYRITIIGSSFFPTQYDYSTGETTLGDNPCIIGELDYFSKKNNIWIPIDGYYGSPYSQSRNKFAILMYNLTSGLMRTAEDLASKYFLIVLPTELNLSDFGNTLTNHYTSITGYSSTLNTLNLSILPWNSWMGMYGDPGYNYIEVDTNGIVSKWEYNADNSKIIAEFERMGINSNPNIPFGSEYIISAGICIIGLIYIVKKRSIISNKSFKIL